MAKKQARSRDADIPEIVQALLDAAGGDTVFADVYLRRASELLGSVLPLAQHRARERVEREIAEAVRQSRTATMLQDWRRVTEIAERIETLRRGAEENAALAALAIEVYDRPAVRIDPFSPGIDALPGFDKDPVDLRDALLEKLRTLTEVDEAHAAFYESRRGYFTGLVFAPRRGAAEASAGKGRDELEQLAAQAAQRGDMAQLNRYAREILALQDKEAKAGGSKSTSAAGATAFYQCPVDLAAPLPDGVAERARSLGLALARTEPLPQAAPLLEYISKLVWQVDLSTGQNEHEGALRAAAVIDESGLGFPPEVSDSLKVLVVQFLRNLFINSGGARYLEPYRAEAVLIEDFPENEEPPAEGELLSALHLPHRRALARQEIDEALLQWGPAVVAERLQLDPLEFRLVCIPRDLYSRFGRDRGWGQQPQWTHFDGYQVLRSGVLRALVGGDVRYGGLADLVSIAVNDRRESVIARFAVIRRARQVVRWR